MYFGGHGYRYETITSVLRMKKSLKICWENVKGVNDVEHRHF